jgi:hypothetical protein
MIVKIKLGRFELENKIYTGRNFKFTQGFGLTLLIQNYWSKAAFIAECRSGVVRMLLTTIHVA